MKVKPEKYAKMKKYAFKKGWSDATDKQRRMIMKGLKKIFDVTTPQAVYARMRGEVEPKASQVEQIEKLFARYDITDVWGLKKKVTIQ